MGEGVKLILALVNKGLLISWVNCVDLGVVLRLDTTDGRWLEGIAVRRLDDILRLSRNCSENEVIQTLVIGCQLLIVGELICRVAQPLGVDVASYNECLRASPDGTVALALPLGRGASTILVPANCGVQGVWEGIAE